MFLDGVHEDIEAELQGKINELLDLNYNLKHYPSVVFETFEEHDLLGLLNVLEPLIKDMVIDPDEQWFKQLLANVVGQYSDVNMDEYLKDGEASERMDLTEKVAVNDLLETKKDSPALNGHIEDINNIFSMEE